jgi:serine/alanine adding enzyme
MNTNYSLTDISSIDRQVWSDFITNHPEGSVFQSPEFYDYLREVPHYHPVGIACSAEGVVAGLLMGFIIRERGGFLGRFYSRVIIHAGPLLAIDRPDKQEICDCLLKTFTGKVKKESLVIQFRNHFNLDEYRDVFARNGFLFNDHLNLVIPTGTTDEPSQTIRKRKLQQVRKSLANGAVITEATTTTEIDDLYSILLHLYKHRVKKPLPSKAFFTTFLRSSINGRLGIILLVKYKDQVVAGMVAPITPAKAMYEWYVCGRDKEFSEIHPSVLITWAGIEYARKKNIPIFDFMGMGNPGKEYGVRNFKMGFGGNQVTFGRFLRINNPTLYSIAKLGLKTLALLKHV